MRLKYYRLYILIIFLAITIGSGVGIWISVFRYPLGVNFLTEKTLHVLLIYAILQFSLIILLLIFRNEILLISSGTFLLIFLSFLNGFLVAKNRILSLINTTPKTYIEGKVKISFLNKVFVEYEGKNIIVYLKSYDYLYSGLGSDVKIQGNYVSLKRYLTNHNRVTYTLYLLSHNVPFVIYTQDDSILESTDSESLIHRMANFLKHDFLEKFFKNIPETFWLSMAMILGESSEVSKEFREDIRQAGISHIFSVSGFHVGVIVFAFTLFLNVFRIPKIIQFLIISIFLVNFSLIVGLKPPVVRASILAGIVLLVRSFRLKPDYLNIVCIIGIFMILFNTFNSVDIGFLLSFSAVISIILFTEPITSFFERFLVSKNIQINNFIRNIITLFSSSLVATLFTMPLILLWFGKSSLIGLFSNVIMIPLSCINISLGILTYLVSFLETLSYFFFKSLNLFNAIFILLTKLFGMIEFNLTYLLDNPLKAITFFSAYYTSLIIMMTFIQRARFKKIHITHTN